MEKALREQGILNMNACIAIPRNKTQTQYVTKNSAQFHEAMGFKKAAHFHECGYKFGQYFDMIWMEKILGKHA